MARIPTRFVVAAAAASLSLTLATSGSPLAGAQAIAGSRGSQTAGASPEPAAGADGLAGSGFAAAAPGGSAASGSAPGTAGATSAVKPALTGLLNEGGLPAGGYGSVIGALSVTATWAALEPVQGGPIASNNAIDKMIAQIRAYNQQGAGLHLRLKLRILAGIDAPNWVKTLDGSPVFVTDPLSNVSGTVGRWWTAKFAAAYSSFQSKLAVKYDSVAEVAEVVATRCTTVYGEPFIRDITNANTVRNLLAAGYTVSADHQCIQQMFAEHTVWKQTRTGVAFSNYGVINPNGTTISDTTFPTAMIDTCRSVLSVRCVIENDNLNSSVNADSPMLLARAAAGGANGFQTSGCSSVGNLPQALQIAVSYGFHAVELCPGYQTLVTPSRLATFPAALAAASYKAPPPEVATYSSTLTGPSEATLVGSVTPLGLSTSAWFQYGTTTAYGLSTPRQDVGSWTTPEGVSASISNLAAGTEYHFRLVASNASGTTAGVDRMVHTPYPPVAVTHSPVVSGSGQLTIAGTVNPRGSATTYYFVWGVNTSYGHRTPVIGVGSGNTQVPVSFAISGLTPGVLYHFELIATNPCGTSYGGDRYLKAQ